MAVDRSGRRRHEQLVPVEAESQPFGGAYPQRGSVAAGLWAPQACDSVREGDRDELATGRDRDGRRMGPARADERGKAIAVAVVDRDAAPTRHAHESALPVKDRAAHDIGVGVELSDELA